MKIHNHNKHTNTLLTNQHIKEFDKKSLRATEMRLSQLICNERVDHSVIAYWESKPEVTTALQKIVNLAGAMLERRLGYSFSMIDSTKFSDWFNDETEFHIVNRIVDGVVYPSGMSFLKDTVAAPTGEATPKGQGKFYGDAWYDDNDTIGVIFTKGYEAIICPNKNRWRGYWRKKARKLYQLRENRLGYRQRGRGESPFGSLTNAFGKRFKVLDKQVMKTRIVARVIVYQIKLLMRLNIVLMIIIRHALKLAKGKLKDKPKYNSKFSNKIYDNHQKIIMLLVKYKLKLM